MGSNGTETGIPDASKEDENITLESSGRNDSNGNDYVQTEVAETVERPPSIEEKIPPSKIYHPLSFPVLVLLAPASILGVLARLGLVALATYDGQSVFPLAYPQALGCFVMGFAFSLKEPLGQFYGPLYTALTTGFCGSLTTFSSWQLDVFESWINMNHAHRGGLRDFMDGLGKSAFTITLSLGSLAFGRKVAALLLPSTLPLHLPNRTFRYGLSVLAVLTYAAVFPAYFRLPSAYRHKATASLLFAYPGTLTRYLLSVYLNKRLKAFPLGTFIANSFGTALLGAFHVLQSTPHPPSPNTCSILQGLIDGYCGCVTTISTFAMEVWELRTWKSGRYVLLSWLMGQALLLVIMGPSFWAGNVHEQVTCRFE